MTNSLQRSWRHYRRARGLSAELITALLSLVIGVVVLPCLIWLVGRGMLGPYAHGGLFALWFDFLRGLAQGSAAFWIVALGPYILLCLLRGGRYLLWR